MCVTTRASQNKRREASNSKKYSRTDTKLAKALQFQAKGTVAYGVRPERGARFLTLVAHLGPSSVLVIRRREKGAGPMLQFWMFFEISERSLYVFSLFVGQTNILSFYLELDSRLIE
jgi:hypothetical protein